MVTSNKKNKMSVQLCYESAGFEFYITTNQGGASAPPFGGFNLGLHVGEDSEIVRKNRAQVCSDLGIPVVFLAQEHTVNIFDSRSIPLPARFGLSDLGPGIDGFVGHGEASALAIMGADCYPVFVFSSATGVFGGAHCGWRGSVAGIIEQLVATVLNDADTPCRSDATKKIGLRAVIGPGICKGCYEVGNGFASDSGSEVQPYLQPVRNGEKQLFDLRSLIIAKLHNAGITNIHLIECCTLEDEGLYSYRRATLNGEPVTGRGALIIKPVARKTNEFVQ